MESWETISKKKRILPENLIEKAKRIREEGKTIATLNGSFDLMHAGHLYIVYEASKAADILIVALNSDDSIKRYKGPKKPIVSLEHRIQFLSALSFVNYVTWFDEDNPCALLEKILPDVHVNGEEYGKNCIEAKTVESYGGKIKLVPRIGNLSTTEVIKKIKSVYA